MRASRFEVLSQAEVEQIHAAIAGRLTEALAECELALA